MFPRSLDSLLLRLVVQLSAFETPFRSPPLFSSQAAAFLLFRLARECPRACTPRLHPAPGKVGLTPGSGPRALASLTVVRPSLTLHHSFSPTWLLSERGLTASVLEAPAHAPSTRRAAPAPCGRGGTAAVPSLRPAWRRVAGRAFIPSFPLHAFKKPVGDRQQRLGALCPGLCQPCPH